MFNLGLSEFALIAVVAVLVIGPKELPVVMAQIGRVVKRLSYLRFAVTQQMNRFLDDSGLGDIRDDVNFETSSRSSTSISSPQDAHQEAIAIAQAAKDEWDLIPEDDAAKAEPKAKTKKKPATKATKPKKATKTQSSKAAAKKTPRKTAAKAKKSATKTTVKKDKA